MVTIMAPHTHLCSFFSLLLLLLASSVLKAWGQGLQTRVLGAGRRGMSGMMGIKDKATSQPIENLPFSAAPMSSLPSTGLPPAVLIPTPGHTDTPIIAQTSPPSKVPEPATPSPVVASPSSPAPFTLVGAPTFVLLPPFANSPVTEPTDPTPSTNAPFSLFGGEPSTSAPAPAFVLLPFPSTSPVAIIPLPPFPTQGDGEPTDPNPSTNAPFSFFVGEPSTSAPIAVLGGPTFVFLPFFPTSPVAIIPLPGDGEPTDPTPSTTNAPFSLFAGEPSTVAPVEMSPADNLPTPGIPPSSFRTPTAPPNRLGSPVSFPGVTSPNFELAACFSGSTTVMVEHQKEEDGGRFVAHVTMKDLKIGDRIAVGDGVYEPIYSFGHYLVNSGHSYQLLEIKTSSHHPISQSEQAGKTKQNQHRARPYKGTLQISHSHLVFLVSRPSSSSSPPSGGLVEDYQHYAGSSTGVNMMAVPASSIQVGDYLWLDESNKNKSCGHAVRVDSITPRSTMVNDGLYAPFTPSGKLLVNNGLLVSSYIGLDGSSADVTILDMSLGDGMSTRAFSLTFQWLAHSFEFPHRVMCYYLASCPKESYDENGISTWVSTPLKMATTWIMSSSSGRTTDSNKDTCLDNDNNNNNNNNKILRSVLWLVLVSVLVVFNMMEALLFQTFVLKPTMPMTATVMMMMMIMIGCIVWCKHAKRGSKKMQG